MERRHRKHTHTACSRSRTRSRTRSHARSSPLVSVRFTKLRTVHSTPFATAASRPRALSVNCGVSHPLSRTGRGWVGWLGGSARAFASKQSFIRTWRYGTALLERARESLLSSAAARSPLRVHLRRAQAIFCPGGPAAVRHNISAAFGGA